MASSVSLFFPAVSIDRNTSLVSSNWLLWSHAPKCWEQTQTTSGGFVCCDSWNAASASCAIDASPALMSTVTSLSHLETSSLSAGSVPQLPVESRLAYYPEANCRFSLLKSCSRSHLSRSDVYEDGKLLLLRLRLDIADTQVKCFNNIET